MMSGKSIKAKLLAGFGAVILLLVAVGGLGIYGLKQVTSPYDHIMNTNFPNTFNLGQIHLAEKDSVIPVSVLLGSTATQQQVNDTLKLLKDAEDKYATNKKEYLDTPFAPGEEEAWNVVDKAWKPFMEMTKHLVELSRSGTKEDNAIRDKLGETKYQELIKQFEDPFNKLVAFQQEDSKKWTKLSADTSNFVHWLSLMCTIAGVVLGFVLAFFMARSLTSTLTAISSQLATGASETSAAVEQLSGASTELSTAATQQSASLQETSSSVEEISSMISKTSESARKSADATEESRTQAVRGKQVVAEMVQSMSNINASNQTIMTEITASNQKIGAIVNVIQEIAAKTKVINDIVFQTKLLSFNASVEAARAGEHGKGFAVVAEEVGNLAAMSGNAAQEISGMLDESVKKVESIIQETKTKVEKLMTDSKTTVDQGSQVATECDKVLDQIVKGAMTSSQLVQEISKASEEQSHGISEIAKAVQQLNEVTHSNATAANQTASTSEQLAAQAHSLNEMASQLQAFIEGGSGATLPRKATTAVKKSPANVISIKRDQPARGAERKAFAPANDDLRFKDV